MPSLRAAPTIPDPPRCYPGSIDCVKLSVSIDEDQVAFIDQYAASHDVGSRSAVIQRALTLLRANELRDSYIEAFREWSDEDRELWDSTLTDGWG